MLVTTAADADGGGEDGDQRNEDVSKKSLLSYDIILLNSATSAHNISLKHFWNAHVVAEAYLITGSTPTLSLNLQKKHNPLASSCLF